MHPCVHEHRARLAQAQAIVAISEPHCNEFMVLGADSLSVIHTWADAAYGVHSDMKSHTGGTFSLG